MSQISLGVATTIHPLELCNTTRGINPERILSDIATKIGDDDFNGSNGLKYLWADAKAAQCSSNQEFLIKHISNKQLSTIDEYIQAFINEWFSRDGYYSGHVVDIIRQGDHIVVTVAWISKC